MSKSTSRSRLAEIIKIFIKYKCRARLCPQKNPEQVKTAFEEFSPTFIKIGQMLYMYVMTCFQLSLQKRSKPYG